MPDTSKSHERNELVAGLVFVVVEAERQETNMMNIERYIPNEFREIYLVVLNRHDLRLQENDKYIDYVLKHSLFKINWL